MSHPRHTHLTHAEKGRPLYPKTEGRKVFPSQGDLDGLAAKEHDEAKAKLAEAGLLGAADTYALGSPFASEMWRRLEGYKQRLSTHLFETQRLKAAHERRGRAYKRYIRRLLAEREAGYQTTSDIFCDGLLVATSKAIAKAKAAAEPVGTISGVPVYETEDGPAWIERSPSWGCTLKTED